MWDRCSALSSFSRIKQRTGRHLEGFWDDKDVRLLKLWIDQTELNKYYDAHKQTTAVFGISQNDQHKNCSRQTVNAQEIIVHVPNSRKFVYIYKNNSPSGRAAKKHAADQIK